MISDFFYSVFDGPYSPFFRVPDINQRRFADSKNQRQSEYSKTFRKKKSRQKMAAKSKRINRK